MKFIETMKVGPRLAAGFGIVLILMLALTGVAISRMSFIRQSLDGIVQGDAARLRLVNSMRDLARYQSVTVRDVVMQDDFAFKKKELLLAKKARESYRDAQEQVAKLMVDDKGKQELAAITIIDEKVRVAIDKVVDLSLSGDIPEAAATIRDQVRPAQIELITAIDALLENVENNSRNAALAASQTYQSAVRLIAVFGVLAVLVGVAAAMLITRSLLMQLGGEPAYASRIAGQIAAGDLAVIVETKAKDRGSLLYAMKEMRDSLARIVAEVRSSTDTINTAASEIAAGNIDLSSRTEQQASSLEETASSMEELTSIVKQNADGARQASALATSASDVARKGGIVVSEVIDTMGAINDSSRKIADIIGVIDGIAFQTNILALNAAVEAARAGEQGRGFAVVASEVRNLAQRSAAAAKEIKELIGNSVEKVDVGARLVDQAGATMTEIVDSVKRVNDIISEIAAASGEQASGIEQVNQAIAQMDEVTQQNSSLVEQAAAAAESMQEQAKGLAQVVSVFRLASAQGTTTQDPAPAPAIGREAAAHGNARIVKLSRKKRAPKLSVYPDAYVRAAKAQPVLAGEWEQF